MASTNPGIVVKPPLGGQVSDKDFLDVPERYARTLLNWLRRSGRLAVRPGFSQLGATILDSKGCGIAQYDHSSGSVHTVVGTEGKWWWWDPAALDWVDITEPANELNGNALTHQVFRVFYKSNKAYLLGVNGHSDAPKKWSGDEPTYFDIGGSPPKAKCMAINNNRLMLGNTYTTQANIHQVDVCDFNDFESGWASVQTTNLMDTPGEIVEMRELGNTLTAIYKTDALYVAVAQASRNPYNFELRVPSLVGPASPRCIVSFPKTQVYMGLNGSVWTFNGVNLIEMPDHIQRCICDTADMGALNYSFGFYDRNNNEVWFIFIGVGSIYPNRGVVINIDDQTVWPISFQNFRPVAGIGTGMEEGTRIGDMVHPLSYYSAPLIELSHFYTHTILVGSDGKVVEDGASTDIGDSIPVEVEMGAISPSEDLKPNFTATEIECLFTKSPGSQIVSVQLGSSDSGNDVVFGAARDIDVGAAGPYIIGQRLTSKLFSLRLTANATQPIQWRGAIVSGAKRGLR